MAKDPLNVLLVHLWWEVRNPGGVVSVMRTLPSALGDGFAVDVLINDWEATRVRTDADGCVPVSRLRLRDIAERSGAGRAFLGWLLALPATLLRLRAFVRARQIDIIHLHYVSPYQVHFALLRLLGGPPYVLTVHGSDVENVVSLSPLQRWAVRRTVRGAERVVAVSRSLGRAGTGVLRPREPLEHIYNGLDWAAVQTPDSGETEGEASPVLPDTFFVTVGNLHHVKGQDILIDAWPAVLARHPAMHLVIVGGGDRMADLQDRAHRLGCVHNVHFTGSVPRVEVFAVLRQATGFLFPSRNEGMGIALIEAGAAGLPVVCSRIPVFEELIEDGRTGLLVEPEDPAAFAAAVCRLLDDPALAERLATAFQTEVRERYSVEAMVEAYRALYRDAVARG